MLKFPSILHRSLPALAFNHGEGTIRLKDVRRIVHMENEDGVVIELRSTIQGAGRLRRKVGRLLTFVNAARPLGHTL